MPWTVLFFDYTPSVSNMFSVTIYFWIISKTIWEQYWTSPGDNTPQDTNYTATSLPSRKLYKLDEPDTQDTAGEARTNSSVMYSYGPPHMAKQKQDDQLEHTYSSYVRIRDVTQKTCQKRWMIERSGERGSGISVLAARHDDDDDLLFHYFIFCFDSDDDDWLILTTCQSVLGYFMPWV